MKSWVPTSLTVAHPEDLGMLSFRRPVLGSKSPVMPCPILWHYSTYMWPSDTLGGTAPVNASSFQEKDLGGRECFLFMATLLSDSGSLATLPFETFLLPQGRQINVFSRTEVCQALGSNRLKCLVYLLLWSRCRLYLEEHTHNKHFKMLSITKVNISP